MLRFSAAYDDNSIFFLRDADFLQLHLQQKLLVEEIITIPEIDLNLVVRCLSKANIVCYSSQICSIYSLGVDSACPLSHS